MMCALFPLFNGEALKEQTFLTNTFSTFHKSARIYFQRLRYYSIVTSSLEVSHLGSILPYPTIEHSAMSRTSEPSQNLIVPRTARRREANTTHTIFIIRPTTFRPHCHQQRQTGHWAHKLKTVKEAGRLVPAIPAQ